MRKRFWTAVLAALMLAQTGCRRGGGPIHIDADQTPPVAQAAVDEAEERVPETDPPEDEAEGPFQPVFSLESGFYSSAQKLTLSMPSGAPKGSFITYTTDCSEPARSSKVFLGQIDVAKGEATVVRAAAFDKDGNRLGPIATNTYIRAEEGRFTLPVFSLVTEKKNLYGAQGILDHPRESGKDWERPCHVEYFGPGGDLLLSQDAAIRVFGGSSRALEQKSFRLIARKGDRFDGEKYDGEGYFAYPFFDGRTVQAGEHAGEPLDRYDRLVLRNGGNDSIQATAADPTAMTLTRDATANAFMAAMSDRVPTQTSRFAAVYLNGAYWGILDLKEDVNDDYFENVYGLEKDAVTVIKSELDTTRHCEKHDNGASCRFDGVWFYYEVDDGAESELDEYEAMCREAVSALGTGEEAAAYQKLRERLDTDSFLEYAALCLYMCNTDWPHNNLRVWRYTGPAEEGNPYSDGRWRFAARDMDFCFGRYECLVLPEIDTRAETDNISFTLGNYKNGAYEYDGNYPDSLYLQGLLALCLHDPEFRESFRAYCEKLCGEEAQKTLLEIMDRYAGQIAEEIPHHLDRWRSTVDGGYTPEVWESNTEDMKRWAEERPAYFREYLSFIDRFAS